MSVDLKPLRKYLRKEFYLTLDSKPVCHVTLLKIMTPYIEILKEGEETPIKIKVADVVRTTSQNCTLQLAGSVESPSNLTFWSSEENYLDYKEKIKLLGSIEALRYSLDMGEVTVDQLREACKILGRTT